MKKNGSVYVLRFAVNVVLVFVILNTEEIQNVYGFPQIGIIDRIEKRHVYESPDDYGYEYDDGDYGVTEDWAFQNDDETKDDDAVTHYDDALPDNGGVTYDDDAVKPDDDGGKDDALPDNGGVTDDDDAVNPDDDGGKDDALPDNGGVTDDDDAVNPDDDGGKDDALPDNGGVTDDDDAVNPDDDGGKDDALPDNGGVTDDDDAVNPDADGGKDDALPDNGGVTDDKVLPDDDAKGGDEVGFCQQSYKTIDAAMRIKEVDFVFVDQGEVIDGKNGKKTPVQTLFPGGPDLVQAAVYSKKTSKAYLFKDEKVWAYTVNSAGQFTLSETSPKATSNEKSHSPECAIQYYDGGERIFLYKEGHFYIFYPKDEDVDQRDKYPVNQYFRGIPSKIDAAISSDDEINFIVDKQAFKMPIHTRTVSKEGKPVESVFNKCKA